MPTITIRVSAEHKAEIERKAGTAGISVSDLVRIALDLHENDIAGLNVRVEEMWRRMERLEELAGL